MSSGSQEGEESKEPALGAVLDFMRLLWAVDHALQSASKRMETSFGVTGPQRLVLRIVGRFPGIAAGRVAEILHVHPSTLTGILKRLETRGMLQRKADPRDARRALFSLTAKGRKLDTVRTGTVEQAVRRVLTKEPDKVVASQQILAALAEELDAGAR
ncbi:MAG TPA: MarR family transcriptional regulator [Myxococcales bacterium]|jgi:DNA-binding MarR family transcriptional regulator|nr:MarR family transcriptional regulator [Myxococcales bacterium]